MPVPPGDLSPEQRAVVQRHRRRPAARARARPGPGKTAVLVARHAWLAADGGVAPEEVLAAHRDRRRRRTRCAREVEDALATAPFEELAVLTVHGFCARLLRDEALEAGLDPFVVPVGARRPARAPARARRRAAAAPPRPARQPVGAAGAASSRGSTASRRRWSPRASTAVGRPTLPRRRRARRARARVRRALPGPRPAAGRARARSTRATSCCWPTALLAGKPHVRAAPGRARAPRARRRRAGPRARRAAPRAPARRRGRRAARRRRATTTRPSGACAAPAALGLRTLAEEVPGLRVARVTRAFRGAARRSTPRRAPWSPRSRTGWPRRSTRAAGRGPCASGAARTSARRPRPWPARSSGSCARASRPATSGSSCAPCSREGQALAVALEERAVPYRLVGARAFFQRAEVKDVLAWLRLLVDPSDAGAVVRALSRAPVELRAIDLARCVQIARRRKLDMVTALVAATESPQLPPEARERVLGFLRCTGRWPPRWTRRGPTSSSTASSTASACAGRGSSPRRPTSSSACRRLARLGDLAASYVRRVAAGDRARLRAPRRRGGRGRAAGRRGRRRGRGRRGRGRGAAHARRPRDGLPPRPRLRPALRAHAGRPAARLRADPRRAAARAAAAATRARCTSTRCGGCCTWR